jgi:hypothetical protein
MSGVNLGARGSRVHRPFLRFVHLEVPLQVAMGAHESKAHSGSEKDTKGEAVQDYYELLGVDEGASADEIKVGYGLPEMNPELIPSESF